MSSASAPETPVAAETSSARKTPIWKKALPYIGTVAIFALIFWRIPMAKVGEALRQAPVLKFVGVFLPFSAFYWMIDSICLTWVVNRFNAPVRFRDIFPIRASMYLLALLNTNLGQGGVAYYLHRKLKISFLEALGSILFIALLEVYQLFLFSTLGVIFYAPTSAAQMRIVGVLRIAYIVAWALLASIIIFFAAARRSPGIRNWVWTGRAGAILATFPKPRPL